MAILTPGQANQDYANDQAQLSRLQRMGPGNPLALGQSLPAAASSNPQLAAANDYLQHAAGMPPGMAGAPPGPMAMTEDQVRGAESEAKQSNFNRWTAALTQGGQNPMDAQEKQGIGRAWFNNAGNSALANALGGQ